VPPGTTWFTLHGLWPNYYNTSYPEYCTGTPLFDGTPYQLTKTHALTFPLRQYWPTLLPDRSTEWFWEYEYNKHGTCASSLPALNTQQKYLQAALSLRGTHDLAQVLRAQGIVPRDDASYSVQYIKDVVRSVYGADPVIGCNTDRSTKLPVLVEIGLCVAKNLTFTNCSAATYAKGLQLKCSGYVVFRSDGYSAAPTTTTTGGHPTTTTTGGHPTTTGGNSTIPGPSPTSGDSGGNFVIGAIVFMVFICVGLVVWGFVYWLRKWGRRDYEDIPLETEYNRKWYRK